MTKRDEFTDTVKRRLAGRVSYKCSRPGCRATTVGPSDDAANGITHTGDAAHITAAAEGGPRWDETLSSTQRRSAENGIWLCKPHAKLIDSKKSVFSVELLRAWKKRAEEVADIAQEGVGLGEYDLIPYQQTFGWPAMKRSASLLMKKDVRQFLADVGALEVLRREDAEWSELTIIELAYNAARYEGVKKMTLRSNLNSLELEYEYSKPFGLAELIAEEGHGGYDAVTSLEDITDGRLALNYSKSRGLSTWILSRQRLGRSNDPCSINLAGSSKAMRVEFLNSSLNCEQVNVYGTLHDSLSDNWVTARYVKELINKGSSVVLHAQPGHVAQHLRRTIESILEGQDGVVISEHA